LFVEIKLSQIYLLKFWYSTSNYEVSQLNINWTSNYVIYAQVYALTTLVYLHVAIKNKQHWRSHNPKEKKKIV